MVAIDQNLAFKNTTNVIVLYSILKASPYQSYLIHMLQLNNVKLNPETPKEMQNKNSKMSKVYSLHCIFLAKVKARHSTKQKYNVRMSNRRANFSKSETKLFR